jgi:hypothetical protein
MRTEQSASACVPIRDICVEAVAELSEAGMPVGRYGQFESLFGRITCRSLSLDTAGDSTVYRFGSRAMGLDGCGLARESIGRGAHGVTNRVEDVEYRIHGTDECSRDCWRSPPSVHGLWRAWLGSRRRRHECRGRLARWRHQLAPGFGCGKQLAGVDVVGRLPIVRQLLGAHAPPPRNATLERRRGRRFRNVSPISQRRAAMPLCRSC